MSDRRCDIQVGLFSIIAVLLLAMMILIFGGFQNVLVDTYTVMAHFYTAAGTTEGTPVRLLGIEVGRVTGITLDEPENGGVLLKLAINKDVNIGADAPLSIRQEGFIANIYVEFGAGVSGELLPKDGTARVEGGIDTFAAHIEKATKVLADMGGSIKEKMADISQRLVTLIDHLNEITGDEEFVDNLKELAANTADVTAQLKADLPGLVEKTNSALAKVEESLDRTSDLLQTYRELGRELTETARTGRRQIERQGANLDSLTDSLAQTARDVSKLVNSLRDVAEMVKSGEGSVGKVFTDAALYRSLVDAIDEIADAAGVFKELAETIKKHPDWLIKGAPKDRK